MSTAPIYAQVQSDKDAVTAQLQTMGKNLEWQNHADRRNANGQMLGGLLSDVGGGLIGFQNMREQDQFYNDWTDWFSRQNGSQGQGSPAPTGGAAGAPMSLYTLGGFNGVGSPFSGYGRFQYPFTPRGLNLW